MATLINQESVPQTVRTKGTPWIEALVGTRDDKYNSPSGHLFLTETAAVRITSDI